jgi:predicted ATP-binding protein involved in virulence
MHSLSSGEAQLFVIMTHLFFNPLAQEGNVFIIDEPELSLHIQWQELFVNSVMAANPNVQFIMATHSPSIILEKTQNCLDLSKGKEMDRLQ